MDSRWVVLSALLLAGAAQAATVKASSEATDEDKVRHTAALAFDGELQTAWAEGEMGSGEGAWIELRFDKPVDVRTISLWAGDLRKGDRSAKESPRPKLVTVTLETDAGPVAVQDALPDLADRGIQRKDIAIEGTAKAVRITIDETFGGFLTNDCYLAEVSVNFHERDTGPVATVRSWLETDGAKKSAEKHRDAVIALFDKIDQSEFGDRDAFFQLVDWAANGAPWVQDKVKKEVPQGFRVQALPPDDVAVEALLKLKDPNAIPGLTMAALRLSGKEQRALLSKVSYFEAWSDLNGGPRRSIPTWGDPGWERGALQGLGEPLAVGQGVYGDLYIADVANHRVSIFAPDGTTRTVWGAGKPTVTDTWFDGTRAWYVAGAEPTTEPGGFVSPVDVAVLQGKDDDELVVLDARGRVQWFGPDGAVLRSWQVKSEHKLRDGVGGEGHLLVMGADVVVVWGDEVVRFNRAGEEQGRWEIEDGAPIAVEPLPGSKLLLGFRTEAVMYSLDGFRHGVVIDNDDLPRGFEAYDLASDDKRKLWAVTDNGWAVKFKKPGKVDWQVRWSERSVDMPRFVVHDGMLYIVAEDKIKQVDALELKAKADAGEDGAEEE
jgi:hypothetical protein